MHVDERHFAASVTIAPIISQYRSACPTECDYAGEAEDDRSKSSAVICFCETDGSTEEKQDIEYTLAIVKPEAVVYRKRIEHIICTEGFEICQTRWLQLTPEQVSEFYNDPFGEKCFPSLVAYMSSGPIVVFVLAKLNAVEEWKLIIGPSTVTEAILYFPDSIRARYGQRGETIKNVVHGSDSCEQAEREIHFFFPNFIVEPLLREEKAEDFLWEAVNPVLVEALILCCKSKPTDPVLWLANWLILNNPNKPKLPGDLALIPT
ncbi:PREDICTED: nucleoside diphosphate kinase homolog 5-like isoform X2 [Dinoponera quadriceps]|uniref:Nucleoside diphosphate kinase homolog 5-like isoform X2 n=1 Tax=Dinoponera quadriceps TaxID=609295 RepID=A0A6P3WZT4_DINQU|nr:PREDICTED: nucleoside diphosphate kinase homolog 5-like isoform X2 [Dinoponera quadriceps]